MFKIIKRWYQSVESVFVSKYADFSFEVFFMKNFEDGFFSQIVIQQAIHEVLGRLLEGRGSNIGANIFIDFNRSLRRCRHGI